MELISHVLKKIKDSPNYNDNEIKECIDSITRQVSEIGLLVDEFSNFARLPNPEFEDIDISHLLINCVNDIKDNYTNIKFDLFSLLNKTTLLSVSCLP